MMQTEKRVVPIWIFAGISLLWLLFLWKGPGICFETNDDKFITEILSGVMTGEPEGHAVYVNYLLSAPLALAYRLCGQIPWYGGMLVLFHFASWVALWVSAFGRGKKASEYAALAGLVCSYMLLDLYMAAVLQYTSTAGLMAVVGYGCLLLHKNPKKGLVLFFFFELAAFLLRSQAMLMVQPVGGALYGGLCLVEEERHWREKFKKVGVAVLILAAVVLLGEAGTLIGYRGEGWREFDRFNKARTELFDYYGMPDYEEAEPILNRYGVTKAQYQALCGFVILDWDDSSFYSMEDAVACVEELAEYAKGVHPLSVEIKSLLREQWAYFRTSPAVQAAWGIVFLWVLLFGRFRLCLPLAGAACGRVLVWGYLLYRGRVPERVTLPLLAGEAFLLAALIVQDYVGQNHESLKLCKKWWRSDIPVLLLGMVFLASCLQQDTKQYRRAEESNGLQQIYIEGLVEIQEYCRAHPEEKYLMDTWSMRFYNGSPLETRLYRDQNYVYTGSWFSNSPPMRETLREYLSGGQDLCLIVENDGSREEHCAVAYLTERFGAPPKLLEELVVSNGGSYLVWQWQ